MMKTPTIRDQIGTFTKEGNSYISQARQSRNGDNSELYSKAIQKLMSAYKFALLLNAKDGTELKCRFELGAAHIDGGDTKKGILLMDAVLASIDYKMEDEEMDFDTRKGEVHFYLATGQEKLGENDKALKNFTIALQYFNQEKQTRRACEAYLKIANIHLAKKDYPEARRNFELCAELYLKSKDIKNSLVARIYQANFAFLDKTYSRDEIPKLLNSICKDYSQVDNENFQGKILCEVGILYYQLRHLDSALFCFDKSIDLCHKIKSRRRRALAYQNAGAILNELKFFRDSVHYHKKAARLHGQLLNRHAQGCSFFSLAFALTELKKYDEARDGYLHALKAFEDTGDELCSLYCHNFLKTLAWRDNNNQKARYHFERALNLDRNQKTREHIIEEIFKAEKTAKGIRRQTDEPSYVNEIPYVNDSVEKYNLTSDSADDYKVSNSGKGNHSKKEFEAKRREYSDENDRPIVHVARGMSNLTDFTLGRSTPLQVDSSSSCTSSSDDENGSSNRTSELRKKSFKPSHRYHMRNFVLTTAMPVHSLVSQQESDQSGHGGNHGHRIPASSTDEINTMYRNQLERIEEGPSDSNLTDVTDRSSISSNDKNDAAALPLAERNMDDSLPSVPTTLSATVTQSLDDTRLYATITKTTDIPTTSQFGRNDTGNGSQAESDSDFDSSSDTSSENAERHSHIPPTNQMEERRKKKRSSGCCTM